MEPKLLETEKYTALQEEYMIECVVVCQVGEECAEDE